LYGTEGSVVLVPSNFNEPVLAAGGGDGGGGGVGGGDGGGGEGGGGDGGGDGGGGASGDSSNAVRQGLTLEQFLVDNSTF